MFFLLPLQLKTVNTGERSGDRHSSVASGGTIGKVWRRDVGPSSPAASYDSSSEECRELCRGLQCQINREREAAIAGPSQSLLASLGGGTDLTDPLPAALRRASITLVTLPSRAICPGSACRGSTGD